MEEVDLATKKGEAVSGQRAWEAVGIEISQTELDELRTLKEKVRSGVKLTYEEEKRLHILNSKPRP